MAVSNKSVEMVKILLSYKNIDVLSYDDIKADYSNYILIMFILWLFIPNS